MQGGAEKGSIWGEHLGGPKRSRYKVTAVCKKHGGGGGGATNALQNPEGGGDGFYTEWPSVISHSQRKANLRKSWRRRVRGRLGNRGKRVLTQAGKRVFLLIDNEQGGELMRTPVSGEGL